MSLFSVEGKMALVTGGSSGIGRMIAATLASNGAKVTVTGRDEARLDEAVAALGAYGSVDGVSADLSTAEGVDRLAQAMLGRKSRLDILVNNAGATWVAPLGAVPERGWDRVFDLNVKSPFFLTQALIPAMSAADHVDWGRVVIISSMRARSAEATSIPYNVSKAAAEHMVRVLAHGLAPHRITANAIAPGWFPSRMNAAAMAAKGQDWLRQIPLDRFGTEADMGATALFLCSKAGAYVTGMVLNCDGGASLRFA